MAQHFLLSAACRPLPVAHVMRMSEARAYLEFAKARWGDLGFPPHCPHCGTVKVYEANRRQPRGRVSRRYRCSGCRADFTVTSGTIFAFHKLSFRQMLAALSLATNAVKDEAALLLTRQLGVQYKTAWVLMMKLREAIASERQELVLRDTVEIDGTYIGGHVRKENKKADRKDRRLAENQNGKRRCVLALRQRGGRIVSVVTMSETAKEAVAVARRYVEFGAVVLTDAHEAYRDLGAYWDHRAVDHGAEYRADDGTTTNLIESFFARVKRSQMGTHHRMAGKYLDWYVAELAWREDMRRRDNGWLTRDLLKRVLRHPVSRWLKGYWQGNHPDREFLWEPGGG